MGNSVIVIRSPTIELPEAPAVATASLVSELKLQRFRHREAANVQKNHGLAWNLLNLNHALSESLLIVPRSADISYERK